MTHTVRRHHLTGAVLALALSLPAVPARAQAPGAGLVAELRTLTLDLLAASRSGDTAKLAASIDNLRLPSHPTWFKSVFGAEEGAAQAAKYAHFLEEFEPALAQRFTALASQPGLEIEISRVQLSQDSPKPPEELPPVHTPLTLFAVILRKPGTDFAPRLAWFVHSDGAFRFVGRMRASTAPPLRIRVAAAVQERKLVHRVAPIYPAYAREAGIAGAVQLEAILKTDGRIGELRVLSGDPTLVAATVAALQQWRYQPTLLDGEPAEVITLISIVFTLDQ